MFTHLHLHTEYSLLDGLSRIPQLLDRAKELGQEACAITDHGALYGVIDFYREARVRDMKPIIGVEAYVAPGDRRSRDPKDKSPYHLTLLARSQQGYRNLLKLVTKANLEGYYYKPRMDRELLEAHGEGIIALSGCNSGEMHKYLLEGRREEALELASWSRQVFDDYYLELQENGLPDVTAANKLLVDLARETELPLVATCDSHYTYPEDASDHDVLLCIGTNSTIHEEKRMKMNAPVYYLQSESEVGARFSELPEAVDNTQRIADSCDVTLEFGRLHLPKPDLPDGVTAEQHLANLAFAGLDRRYNPVTQDQRARLQYELDVVSETGFTNYFLVVYDIAMFARRAGIPMGVRGSAAASVILYCLGVTDVDPLRYRLVFERFLNVERREMPDVDFDFADDRRDEILRYTAQKYGSDRVAQIITFGTLGAKAAIRDVGRAFGMSFGDTDRIARLVPYGVGMTLEKALEQNQELAEAMDADPQVQKLVETAQRLEGVARHSSTHAAGIVISREPLVEHVPLQLPPRSDSEKEDALPTTQFAMNQVAEIGLLKLDVLGLVNLTILGRAVDLIKETRGIEIDLQALPDDDPTTFEMLSKGETFGVFQLESGGMRRSIQELRPASIGDLSAMVALYRPGPMEHIPTFCKAKNGEQKISYPHKDLADILDETYGVITYQDQVMLIAQKFAGYTLGQADVMRKAMGKKIADVMHAEYETFIKGAKRNGYSEGDAQEIFELIRPFAGYAFNKAHAVCYATIAYQTGYLKAHYPAEYMVAVLGYASSHPSGGQSRIAAAAAECARLGIDLQPPDVNISGDSFTLESGVEGRDSIRFGLRQVKNVGAGAAESIVAEREAHGRFESLEDFCRRIDLTTVNKRAMESLIKAGALTDFGARATLLANVERIMSLAQREQKLKESGQATMFDLFGDEVATPMPAIEMEEASVPRKEELDWEKELLGLYVSEHPFKAAASVLGPLVTAQCGELEEEMTGGGSGNDDDEIVSAALPPKGRIATIAGMVGNTRRLYTRDGRPFCAAVIEDLSGMVEVTVWPELFEKTQDVWMEGNIVLLEVRVRERNARINIAVQRVEQFDPETESTNYVPPTWLTKAAENPNPTPSYGNGNGSSYWKKTKDVRPLPPPVRAADPSAGPAPAPPKPPPPPAPPAPEPPSVVEPEAPAAEPQAAVATATRESDLQTASALRIELRETDDEDADRDRLERLLGTLADFPGDEEVRLTVHTLDGQSQIVKLGKVRVTIDGELLTQLQDVLGGAGSVSA